MSFLNDTATGRRLVFFGARLLVQSAMACATPQLGMDELKFFRIPHRASDQLIARHERAAPTCSFTARKPYQTV